MFAWFDQILFLLLAVQAHPLHLPAKYVLLVFYLNQMNHRISLSEHFLCALVLQQHWGPSQGLGKLPTPHLLILGTLPVVASAAFPAHAFPWCPKSRLVEFQCLETSLLLSSLFLINQNNTAGAL